jgi:hypothetical protein
MGTKNLRRIARKNKSVLTDDPDALLSVLQITKRLVLEAKQSDGSLSIMDALAKALPMSSPKDQARTWWSALRVLHRNASQEKSSLAILADAIAAQGKTNAAIKKRVAA